MYEGEQRWVEEIELKKVKRTRMPFKSSPTPVASQYLRKEHNYSYL